MESEVKILKAIVSAITRNPGLLDVHSLALSELLEARHPRPKKVVRRGFSPVKEKAAPTVADKPLQRVESVEKTQKYVNFLIDCDILSVARNEKRPSTRDANEKIRILFSVEPVEAMVAEALFVAESRFSNEEQKPEGVTDERSHQVSEEGNKPAIGKKFEAVAEAEAVGALFTVARETVGLSKKAAEAKSGISRANIASFEKGKHSPTLERIQKYAEALGLEAHIELVPKGRE